MLALLKIAGIFAVVVMLIRLKAPLWTALASGAVITAPAFGMKPLHAVAAFGDVLVSKSTIEFVSMVGLVMALSLVLKEGGQIARLTENLRRLVPRPRFLAAALPAIVGLLPMPGGALFSAPMVDAACGEGQQGATAKTCANHWFRHVWEYTWPIYPGMILSAGYLDIRVGVLSLVQSPLTVLAVVAGGVFLLPKLPSAALPQTSAQLEKTRGQAAGGFFLEMSPFLLVVALHLALGLDLVLCLGIGIAWAFVINAARRTATPLALFKAVLLRLGFYGFLLMAFAVKLFGGMLAESGALTDLGAFFSSAPVPVLAVAILLPMIAGYVAGITIVYVSTTFPVLLAIPVIAADPLPFLVLAYAAGFAGTLISPLHACLVLCCKYFKSGLFRSATYMALPTAVVLGGGVALFFLYRAWPPV